MPSMSNCDHNNIGVELSEVNVTNENGTRGVCWHFNLGSQFPIINIGTENGEACVSVDCPHKGYSIQTTFVNGKPNGDSVILSEKGVKVASFVYVDGIANGPYVLYDDDGKLYFEGFFKNGFRDGKGREYDEFGNVIYEGMYIKGEKSSEMETGGVMGYGVKTSVPGGVESQSYSVHDYHKENIGEDYDVNASLLRDDGVCIEEGRRNGRITLDGIVFFFGEWLMKQPVALLILGIIAVLLAVIVIVALLFVYSYYAAVFLLILDVMSLILFGMCRCCASCCVSCCIRKSNKLNNEKPSMFRSRRHLFFKWFTAAILFNIGVCLLFFAIRLFLMVQCLGFYFSTEIFVPPKSCNVPFTSYFSLSLYKRLESINIGHYCFGYVKTFRIDGLNRLKTIKIGNYSFTREKSRNGNDASRSFHILNCAALTSIDIGQYSFCDYAGAFELKKLPSLSSIRIGEIGGENSYNFCYSLFVLTDLPNLVSIELGRAAFFRTLSVVISNLPKLESINLGIAALSGKWFDDLTSLEMGDLPKLEYITSICNSFVHQRNVTLYNIPNLKNVTLPGCYGYYSFQYVETKSITNVSPLLTDLVQVNDG